MAESRPDRILGPGHDEFWEWCGKGELRLQRCGTCGKLSWPAVGACEYCGSGELTWERMSGKARLISWCTFERDYYRGALPLPWETILVELEEGVLFLSNPVGLTWRDMEPDMPMRLTFAQCEDSAGLFQLPVFERG